MNKRERKNKGFTLIELMIVISILGLIIVMSLPNYSRFIQGWKLNGEAQQFTSVLRTARSTAIMKNIDVVFTFNNKTNTYSYFEDANKNSKLDSGEYQSATYTLYPGISIIAYTLSSSTLTFGSKGNTQESGSITLINSNNKVKNIRIYGGTGNITIE